MSRTLDTPLKHAIVRNAVAKDGVFKAQDAAELIEDDEVRFEVKRSLSRARGEMEHADRLLRDAMARGIR
jgi:hypothetical protein